MERYPPGPLDSADSSWWHMEEPTNPMVITGVITFESPLDFDRLRRKVEERLLAFRRFRQRVAEPALRWGRARWVDDEAFSLDHHVRRMRIAEPAGHRELEAAAGELMSRPLDFSRPLWEFHLVENFRGGSALLVRLHHCIADGMALVQLLLSIDDTPGNEGADGVLGVRREAPPLPASVAHPLRGGGGPAVARALGLGARALGSLGYLVGMWGDPRTAVRGRLGTRKAVVWSREPFPLDEIRAAARRHGCTLHDMTASVVAGGLGRYLAQRGGGGVPARLRAVVPVSLRGADELDELGNRFGLVFLPMHVGVGDPVARMHATKREMDRLKRSPQAWVVYALLRTFGRVPRSVLHLIVRFLGWKASLVMTTVPGPREPVWFCGSRIESLMAWVPQSGRLSVGVSVISYAGTVRVGVATDAGRIPDPGALARAIRAELDALLGAPAAGEAAVGARA